MVRKLVALSITAVCSRAVSTLSSIALIGSIVHSMRNGDELLATTLTAVLVALVLRDACLERRQQERLDMVLDAATELAVLTTDVDGNITIFNRGAELMLGYDSKEVMGDNLSHRLHDPVESKTRAAELGVATDDLIMHSARSDAPATQDWTFVSKDGRQLIVSLALTALRRRAGQVVGYLGIAADVTQRRHQERERERLLWLEQDLTQKLIRQNDELMRMDRTKDEFVATVSHEFRTPLTSIKGYLETLIDEDAGKLNDSQKRFLQIVERNAERLGRLVEDLLFAARVDAGGSSVAVFTEVDLGELFNEVTESARPHAKDKHINLISDVDGSIIVAADPARMLQLLDNLTNNAIKFTPEEGTVTLSAQLIDENAVITVSDTGIGIPEDEQSNLFQRFFRSRLAHEHAIDGTGIGLAVVKEIADAHGATLSVTSAEGKGTSIQITMPALVSELAFQGQ